MGAYFSRVGHGPEMDPEGWLDGLEETGMRRD
jgi:hypothetical protein